MTAKIIKITVLLVLAISDVKALELVKVVILGRHNIRTPLISSDLEKVTTHDWPQWTEESSFLTAKGRLLESYMGEYFSQWLRKEGLFTKECPEESNTLIYSNVVQRTRETAKEFAAAAFKKCNVTVHYRKDVENDPVFHPIIRNTSEIFKQIVAQEMQERLNGLTLNDAYTKLNEVLDFSNSRFCNETNFCDFTKQKDEILIEVGEEPNIYGPLSIGNSAMDALLMAYYNGTEDVGWGKIADDDWGVLTKITKENQNVRFNSTFLGAHVAELLLRKMNKIIRNDKINFAMLVGHDSNITPVLATLGAEPYELPNQYEKTPVGGKVVFQKWYDEKSGKYLLKIEYVYQTTEQIKYALPLSLDSPPQHVPLQLASCKYEENGFCDWEDFCKLISKF
ncbi:glucose-1-phosphatase [Phthorimaea operculella]|nr:glucose-1-phosphatase [Phthorimaea operculella]